MWTQSWHRVGQGYFLFDKLDNTGYLRSFASTTRKERVHASPHSSHSFVIFWHESLHVSMQSIRHFHLGGKNIIKNVTPLSLHVPSQIMLRLWLISSKCCDLSVHVWPFAFGMVWCKVLQHSSTPPLFIRQWPCDPPSQASVSRWQERSGEATRCTFSSLKMIGFFSDTNCNVFIVTCI